LRHRRRGARLAWRGGWQRRHFGTPGKRRLGPLPALFSPASTRDGPPEALFGATAARSARKQGVRAPAAAPGVPRSGSVSPCERRRRPLPESFMPPRPASRQARTRAVIMGA
jgi:hypothetical protein